MVPDHGRCRFDTGSLMKLQLLAGQPSRTLKHAAAALYMCCMYLLKLSYGMGAVFWPFLRYFFIYFYHILPWFAHICTRIYTHIYNIQIYNAYIDVQPESATADIYPFARVP